MTNNIPLLNVTHYSLGLGLSKPSELTQKAAELGYKSCGICDYKTLSGAIDFYKSCKNVGIKPIIGCSFGDYSYFAKNKDGWVELLHLVSSLDKNGNLPNDIKFSDNLYFVNNRYHSSSYYINKEDRNLHNILLCSKLKTTLREAENKKNEYSHFFNSTSYSYHVGNTGLVEINDEEFEDYELLNQPQLPTFPTPNGETEEKYFQYLCNSGWQKFLVQTKTISDKRNLYLDRLLSEFEVIKEANLFGYFLIVQDIVNYAKSQGWMTGAGRGSAAGCLISYLLGITQVDPIKYDLIFERFYNKGRNTATHISLPDIDLDIPAKKRDQVIEYIKNKYGHDHVGQIATFGRLQGRSAIKEVFRIKEACSFSEMNEITKYIPDEAKISDQLEEMGDERSIIMWALINNSEDLKDFCYIDHNGELRGDYAEHFKQAIALEGTYKTQGKHAAGVVISKDKLIDVCPLIYQKDSDEKMCGFEMEDLESCGLVKLDILGLSLLDKLMYIEEL